MAIGTSSPGSPGNLPAVPSLRAGPACSEKTNEKLDLGPLGCNAKGLFAHKGIPSMASDLETRIRNVTAVLGPTNTGKTHLAIERMLGHETGMIGLPLRLLAREVYDKIAQRIGAD